ncbi:hypothetical protein B6V75_08985 [Thioclava sp. F1Mire-8]|uniref:phage/plasmid primase, P4 family n=1 Tax=Thioclava sp. F1Mire-8 TaxID=1973006 RepID=UPI000B53D1B6|nr:phage/plasmid primase, P4 family [Thioclava sp. F1Mire-8]OWY03556.1 hypothetical protein B6V75_08985 [Thioclava sp. F1Mire-8]
MTKYSSIADPFQGETKTDLSDLFTGFSPGQVSAETDPTDLFQPTPPAIENVDVALSLATRGLAVCPVRQWGDGDGWKPISGFKELASTDAAQIRKWWRDWPEARVALITGERNGISVLDVDVKNGKDGLLSLSTLGFDDHRAMTPIRTVTPSGGFHLFFAYKPDLKATVGKIGPGLDVRNNGGFVIAPGSLKDGKLYQVEGEELAKEMPLPNWPESLTPPSQPERQPVDIQAASDFHSEWALDYLAKRVADVAATAEGGRQAVLNDASLWAGGAGAHGALSREHAEALLVEAGKTCGLSEREARDTFNHGWSDGLRKPIELPPDYSNIADLLDDLPENFAGFPMTEDGVALAFAARNADRLRFCHSSGRWYVWTGSHWQKEESKLAFDWARQMCRTRAASEPRSAAAKALAKAATASAVERFAQADRAFAVTADLWDREHWLLGTPGGTVNLRTGELRPARQSDMITKITAATPIPLESFDPKRDCPRWMAFLDQATGGDAGAIRFLQQWAGYSLTGDTREDALLFVHGPGGSGKSTAIVTLGDVLGDYAISMDTETITAQKHARHSTEVARLHGARMVFASETEAGRAWAENRIKQLTGGDVMTARFMRQDDFSFKPQLKLVIVGNNKPAFSNVDGAIKRRFNVLPFDKKPASPDQGLKDALKAEFPGILSWAIQGCLDWQQNGLVRPAIMLETTADYFESQDIFAQWLADQCITGAREAATTADLFESWSFYARSNGEDPGSKVRTFPEKLTQHGFKPVKDAMGIRGRGFSGLSLKIVPPTDDFALFAQNEISAVNISRSN